jgi:hypothetical protein
MPRNNGHGGYRALELKGPPQQRQRPHANFRDTTRVALPRVRFAHLLVPESAADLQGVFELGFRQIARRENHGFVYELPEVYELTSIDDVRLNARALGALGIGHPSRIETIRQGMSEHCQVLAGQIGTRRVEGRVTGVEIVGRDLVAEVESDLVEMARDTVRSILLWAGVEMAHFQPLQVKLGSSEDRPTLDHMWKTAQTWLVNDVNDPLVFDLLAPYVFEANAPSLLQQEAA